MSNKPNTTINKNRTHQQLEIKESHSVCVWGKRGMPAAGVCPNCPGLGVCAVCVNVQNTMGCVCVLGWEMGTLGAWGAVGMWGGNHSPTQRSCPVCVGWLGHHQQLRQATRSMQLN